MTIHSGAPDEADRRAHVLVSVTRLTVPVSVAPLFGEVPLPLEHLGGGDHLLVAAGVLLERGSCASFTSHELYSLSTKILSLHGARREHVNIDVSGSPPSCSTFESVFAGQVVLERGFQPWRYKG